MLAFISLKFAGIEYDTVSFKRNLKWWQKSHIKGRPGKTDS